MRNINIMIRDMPWLKTVTTHYHAQVVCSIIPDKACAIKWLRSIAFGSGDYCCHRLLSTVP